MGSIGIDNFYQVEQPADSLAYWLAPGRAYDECFGSFQIFDLVAGRENTLTGLGDELVLLSWLFTLLQTREENDVTFDWAHCHLKDGYAQECSIKCFTMAGLITDMGQTVEALAAKILSRLEEDRQNSLETHKASPISLVLSTTSHDISHENEQVREHCTSVFKLLTI